jgi:hypothetical protein
MDATRPRRTRDRARQRWYARHRQQRSARFLGFPWAIRRRVIRLGTKEADCTTSPDTSWGVGTTTRELKEPITMPRVPTTPFPFLLTAALATAFMPDRATRAGVVLAVDNPQHNGVMTWDGTPEDFAPASDSPAHAIAGNGRSSLRLLGSQMALSFVGISVSTPYPAVFPSTQGCGRRPMCVQECRARRSTLSREIPDQLMGCGTGPSAKG